MKFPKDSSIDEHYDYVTFVRDLGGKQIIGERVVSQVWKMEVLVPNGTFGGILGTIYEVCVGVRANTTKNSQNSTKTQKYIG